jgi:DNA-binding protein H-NS
MSNLLDIQTQIQKLQKQAEEIRSKEFDKTVREIVEKMQAFGITLKDIQAALGKPRAGKGRTKPTAKKPAAKKTGKKTTTPVAAKYRGPSGETWSGRGLMPRWLAALVAQGRTKEEFAIQ